MRDGEETIVRRKENFKGKESKKRENREMESLTQDLGESENDPFSQQTPLRPKVNYPRENEERKHDYDARKVKISERMTRKSPLLGIFLLDEVC